MTETSSAPSRRSTGDVVLHIGHDELVIRQRYEIASIANDVLIGVWFLVGSCFFFSDALMTVGTVLFVIGSVEMLIRPVIRLVRHLHLQRFHASAPMAPASGQDF